MNLDTLLPASLFCPSRPARALLPAMLLLVACGGTGATAPAGTTPTDAGQREQPDAGAADGGPLDSAPPVLSAGAPSGVLPANTQVATLSVQTDEPATCRYATVAGMAFAQQPLAFATTGGRSHSAPLNGLQSGQTFSFFVRCEDSAGNANISDLEIAFSVALGSVGVTDSLGIYHPNLPANGWIGGHARLYLSRSTTVTGTRSTQYDPYYVGGAEGFEATAPGSENWSAAVDATRPFQAQITKLSPGAELNVAWFKLSAGEIAGSSWAATYMRPIHPGATTYPPTLRKKFRRIYNHFVMKWLPNMAAVGASGKITFFDGAPENSAGSAGLNLSSNSPNVIFTPKFNNSFSPTAPLSQYMFNLQGTPDNNLTGTVNGVQWQSGGVSVIDVELARDTWYSIETIVTASTSVSASPPVRDGSVEIWLAAYDAQAGTFAPSVKIFDATGLELSAGKSGLPAGVRSYMTRIQRYFQYAGTSQTYAGPDTGAYVALDYIAMSEN